VLLTPVSPVAPPEHGAEAIRHFGRTWALRELVMPFVVPQDLVGLPSVAVRAGFDAAGLPVGIQLCGPVGSDHRMLALARDFYEATPSVQGKWPDPLPVATPGPD
jgi:aspartyl-tRNA(Asn)/glutamyl-tRNA(Gln) amidotransferase subunit A